MDDRNTVLKGAAACLLFIEKILDTMHVLNPFPLRQTATAIHPLPSDPNYWLEFADHHPQKNQEEVAKKNSKIDPNMSWEMHTKELLSRFDGIEFRDLDGQWKISTIASFFWLSLFLNKNPRDHIGQRANPLARGKVSFFVQHLGLLATHCKLCNYVILPTQRWFGCVVGEMWCDDH